MGQDKNREMILQAKQTQLRQINLLSITKQENEK